MSVLSKEFQKRVLDYPSRVRRRSLPSSDWIAFAVGLFLFTGLMVFFTLAWLGGD